MKACSEVRQRAKAHQLWGQALQRALRLAGDLHFAPSCQDVQSNVQTTVLGQGAQARARGKAKRGTAACILAVRNKLWMRAGRDC
jgi:hypothetical protein